MPARAKKFNKSNEKAEVPAAATPDQPARDQPASDYEARYGQLPRATRFKPGQSGNPSGRPRATRRLLAELEAALSAPVTIKAGSRKRQAAGGGEVAGRPRGLRRRRSREDNPSTDEFHPQRPCYSIGGSA